MNIFLIIAAVLLFIFGMILLLKPNIEKKLSDFLNKNILPIEDKMRKANKLSGLLLLALSIVIFYLVTKK